MRTGLLTARRGTLPLQSIDQQRKLPTGSLQTQNFGAPWMRITTGPAALTTAHASAESST